MIFKAFLVVAVCGLASAFMPEPNPYDNPIYFGDEFLQRWDTFRNKFNKTYATQTEEAVRMMMFRMNCMAIDAHNSDPNAPFKMGETYFTDFSAREFGKVLGSSPRLARDAGEPESEEEIDNAIDDGKEVDYSTDSCIGPVEHQQTCGSCYAFSTTHVAAWHHCKKTGKHVSFSEQQIVDCSKKNNGCTSGFTKTAGKYIVKNGIVAEEDYPYKSEKDKCHKENLADEGKLYRPISGTKNLPKKEKSLKPALSEHGPLMVIIDGTNLAFYSGGVISGSFCDHGEVNHAVVLVGSKDKKWRIKNSWGPEWGEGGYFNVEMDSSADKGCLGIAGYPSYAIPA